MPEGPQPTRGKRKNSHYYIPGPITLVPGIQHTGPQTWTQQTGWTNPQWTNGQWTTPQWNTPQGWTTPNWQTNGISHSAWEPTWQMRPWTWNQMW